MAPINLEEEAKCPVDHKTREKWLAAGKARDQQTAPNQPRPTPSPAPTPTDIPTAQELKKAERNAELLAALRPRILALTQDQRTLLLAQYQALRNTAAQHQSGQTRFSLDHSHWVPSTRPPPAHKQNPPPPPPPTLNTAREVSSIPRAQPTNHDRHPNSAEAAATPTTPANSERDTGHDAASGHWLYPSQQMFFDAMQRKGHAPPPDAMSTIVPIHNAVNERAWAQIAAWEEQYTRHCGGPKLVSFSGDSKKLTPRARWRGWLGYEMPFDRHDWVVDRCGERVGYVIDFYSGKQVEQKQGAPSFFLDVRPKVESWLGVRTRVGAWLGW